MIEIVKYSFGHIRVIRFFSFGKEFGIIFMVIVLGPTVLRGKNMVC